MRKVLPLLIGLLLLASAVPLTIAQTNNEEQELATSLIKNLGRLSKFVEDKVEPIKDKLNNATLENYEIAENYKKEAMNAYDAGDYEKAVTYSLLAMRHYKAVLSTLREAKSRYQDLRFEVERTLEYFRFVNRTIALAQEEGIDVSNLTRLFNETREAYKAVLEDIKAKDYEKAREDLKVAREKKTQLDEELRKVRRELAYANADKIVRMFLERGGRGIEIVERAANNGHPELNATLTAFKEVYEEVKSLADQGKWQDALKVIEENRETIEKFQRTVRMITHGKASLRDLRERIERCHIALQRLREKGIDTRVPEVQLKVATQEVMVGLRLLKKGRPMEARAHFTVAQDLLSRVERFIAEHGGMNK
ncbi:hypothetical protein A3L04_05285 [Thermococcus chitonophagus]|uniref:DNA double-strand break repair Rad50 ATPase n=1 Tax=Thermococcus chitonophagus TaxID=54262 RepID=A0A160VSC9_9EURY|nr:hypothetical protein [Thermococcus chitonophagus]ASJ16528.1 hypothetical protein A3L04_05285 [Thermococcus chitonophagus]CUX77569.1 hypothetical protein CHITON_0790 [Thermococcus chitonophagus]